MLSLDGTGYEGVVKKPAVNHARRSGRSRSSGVTELEVEYKTLLPTVFSAREGISGYTGHADFCVPVEVLSQLVADWRGSRL